MKKTIARAAAGAAIATLALAGCGLNEEPVAAPTIEQEPEEREAPSDGDDVAAPEIAAEADAEETEQDEKPAVEQGGPGVYQAPIGDGGVATVAVPGTGPEDIESYREAAGVDPVGYLVVEVDNTEGSMEAMLFEAKVVDSEGKTYVYHEVMTGMDGWAGENYDLLDRELELWDSYPYSTLPSAINTVPLIGPEVPEDIVSVFIEYEQAERVGDL